MADVFARTWSGYGRADGRKGVRNLVLVVYTAAYIALGIAESVLARTRPAPDPAALPPAIRAELEADEALEPEPEDVEGDKREQDEYI